MSSGRSGGQRHLGRVSPLHLALDAGGQHRANQFGAVPAETDDAVRDPHGSLNEEMSRTTKRRLCIRQHFDTIPMHSMTDLGKSNFTDGSRCIRGDLDVDRLPGSMPSCCPMEMCVTNKNLLRVTHGVPSPKMLSSTRTDLIINALQHR